MAFRLPAIYNGAPCEETMTAPIDYNAVLADLLAKREKIDAAIEVIRSMVGLSGGEESGQQNGQGTLQASVTGGPAGASGTLSTAIRNDSFFGLSTPAAVKKYLGMMKRPQSVRAIADALRDGGQVHAADDKTAYTNAYTALTRGKDTLFSQTRNGEWALAEWYSNKPKSDTD